MGIVQENLVNVKRPDVKGTEYGAEYVKVVETNDVPTPQQVTKETVVEEPEKEAEAAPSTEGKAAPKRGRGAKKAK